jgi:UTP:GlnB (protein PII) uridylyltransferase
MARWAEFDWGTETDCVEVSAAVAETFSASMPPRYRVLFDLRTARKHAGVCIRRGEHAAHAEVWRTLADGSAALCVVADDRPGLLSAVAAALVFHRLDVVTALVFSRTLPSGAREAVDLVWVRRANSEDKASIDDDEATSVGQVLSAILSGAISVEEIAAKMPCAPERGEGSLASPSEARDRAQHEAVAHETVPRMPERSEGSLARPSDARDRVQQDAGGHETIVRFDEQDEEGLSPLIVEAADRPGILLAITREIFQQGAQIVRSLVRSAGGRAFNHFELAEFNGGPLSPERREQIRSAVFAAVSLRGARESEAERPAV